MAIALAGLSESYQEHRFSTDGEGRAKQAKQGAQLLHIF